MLVVSDTEALRNWPVSTGRKSAATSWVQTQLDELEYRFEQEKWAAYWDLGYYNLFNVSHEQDYLSTISTENFTNWIQINHDSSAWIQKVL